MATFTRAIQQAARRRRLAGETGGIGWTLDHDYTAGSLHADDTFARASAATYVDASGNIASATTDAARALSRLSRPRGPWCLRDSGGGCSFGAVPAASGVDELSRAAFRKPKPR